jgi:hypothetical protein
VTISYLIELIRVTKWTKILNTSGRTKWLGEPVFTGWREAHDDVVRHAQYVGEADTGECFYVNGTISDLELTRFRGYEANNFIAEKQVELQDRFMSYLDPECMCKLGFHWKCSIHQKWIG